jgi:hypothetical protein
MSAVLFQLAASLAPVPYFRTNMNVKVVGGGKKQPIKNVVYIQVI